jgi:hypothetical protein
MRTRDRDPEEEQRSQQPGATTGAGGTGPGGDELRDRARRLLELGDETISNALSQNSERFLQQNRQQGGQ